MDPNRGAGRTAIPVAARGNRGKHRPRGLYLHRLRSLFFTATPKGGCCSIPLNGGGNGSSEMPRDVAKVTEWEAAELGFESRIVGFQLLHDSPVLPPQPCLPHQPTLI